MAELHDMTALEQAAAVGGRPISPVELGGDYPARVEARNTGPGAVVTVPADDALARAKEAEELVTRADPATLPPLHGVPTAIKDLNLTAGTRTTLGSTLFAD